MKEIKGLSVEQHHRYRHAINCGYFDSYGENPREWRHSFTGAYVWKYPGRIKHLQLIADIVGHTPQWEDITDEVVRDFVEELRQTLSTSSTRTICAELKALLNANKRRIPSVEYMDVLTLRNEVSQSIYLTRAEMERFISWKPRTPAEKFVHRNFCVELLTGARLVDAQRLTVHNCDFNTNLLSYVPKKTPGIIVRVPVDERHHLRRILNRTDGKECCLDMFNSTVRRICKELGFYDECSITRCGKTVIASKWQLVSSHTARRSFATNLYLAGVSLEDIALMMGHGKNIETTKRYICAERQISQSVMAYFQPEKFRHEA